MSKMQYLKEKPIAVLGAGALGKTCAADCAIVGAKVRLCDLEPFAKKSLLSVENGIDLYSKNGKQINRYGFFREGKGYVELATTSVKEAVKGAGLILVTTPAFGHEVFFKELIPHLEDGMVIHIFPDNYGTLLLRKMMKEMGCNKNVIIGGWSSAPYGTRVDFEGGNPLPRVAVEYRAITLRGCALPMSDNEAFFESIKYFGCMDSVVAGDGPSEAKTVLDTCFSNVNPVLHCPPTILGVGAMENWNRIFGFNIKDFSIYSHIFSESVSEVQYAFYNEEIKIAEALGIDIQRYEKEQFFHRKSILAEEFWGKDFVIPFDEIDKGALGTGPFDISTRYITEDVPVGCKIYHELAKTVNVKTPVIDSIITLASTMSKKNFFEEGYTLEYLGIGAMDTKQMINYLMEG